MLNWGIIGCGDVVEHKSGPALLGSAGSRIVAVMRRDLDRARDYARRCGVAVATDDAREVFARPDVDIIYVATPPDSHEEYVLAAAAAGKHVLVEKPMGLSVAQAERMIAACDRTGRQFFVAYYRRFDAHVQKMRGLILDGVIGEPVQAFIDLAKPVNRSNDAGWRERVPVSGGGHFVDVGCHRLDIMVYLLGDVDTAHGVVSRRDPSVAAEQAVALCVRFKSGAQLAALGDYTSGRRADHLRVIGVRGEVVMDSVDSYAVTLKTDAGERVFAFEPTHAHHLGLVRHIESVLAGREDNACSGRDGLQTEIILDAAVRSHLTQ